MNSAESTRPGNLLVSRQFLAFGWEIQVEWCSDWLDLPMRYLQLQSWLNTENDNNFCIRVHR